MLACRLHKESRRFRPRPGRSPSPATLLVILTERVNASGKGADIGNKPVDLKLVDAPIEVGALSFRVPGLARRLARKFGDEVAMRRFDIAIGEDSHRSADAS